MHLKNEILRDRNGIEALMYYRKNISVSCNLLFIAVFGCSFLCYKLLESGACSDNSFNSIRSFSTLYLSNFNPDKPANPNNYLAEEMAALRPDPNDAVEPYAMSVYRELDIDFFPYISN